MQAYKNISLNSGVTAFEIGNDYIKVKFKDGPIYIYTYTSAGKENIEQMKEAALKGIGLSTFISK